jgi:hypothetical protein
MAEFEDAEVEDQVADDTLWHRMDVASGIYGTILVTAVVAGASADPHVEAWKGALVVLVTTVVFWIAHIYANLLALHRNQRRRSNLSEAGEVGLQELPLVFAGILPILILLILGAAGVTSRDTAFTVAVWSGAAVLFAGGIILARRDGHGVLVSLLSASILAGLGIVIIILKILVTE